VNLKRDEVAAAQQVGIIESGVTVRYSRIEIIEMASREREGQKDMQQAHIPITRLARIEIYEHRGSLATFACLRLLGTRVEARFFQVRISVLGNQVINEIDHRELCGVL